MSILFFNNFSALTNLYYFNLQVLLEQSTDQADVLSSISNSNLLNEQGRHQNIPLENRLCPICKLEIENEYHFVIECNKLTSSRSKLYSKVTDIVPNFLVMSDMKVTQILTLFCIALK
jgi:hypothetical protein